MLLGEIVRVALEALRANKLRSLLTMLGIIIGVGAVITMIALGSGAQKAVQDRIQALGPTLLSIYPGQSFMRGVASGNRVSLTMDDDTALANNARYLSAVVPELSSNLQVQKADQNINVTVMGTTPNYATVHNYTVTAGRMFTAGDDAARRRVAVLGSAVPQMLNSNRDAMIGQDVLIRSISFEIIGVLSEKGSQGSFFNPDEQILIPLQTARYRVMGTDRLRDITVQARDLNSMNLAMLEIERVMRRQHKIRPGQDNDFQIRNQTDILATLQQTTDTFKYLLAGIAAVSLLVGGIGIMNIMLANVSERTREIGVRRAIGATKGDILGQFLIETVLVCLPGGVIGVVVGVGMAKVITYYAGWTTGFALTSVVVALGMAAAVGLVFGLFPARRAAQLDPVQALRSE